MKSDCYCIVLRAATRRIGEVYDSALEPLGINVMQFSLLRRIKYGAPLSLTDLSRLAELDRSTVGRNVKVLQREGLVRVTSGQDQREALLELEPKGLDIVNRGKPLWATAQAAIEQKLGLDGAEQLQELLSRF